MPENFDHVHKGQPVRLWADTWNIVLDTARAYKQNRLNGGAKPAEEEVPDGLIRVFNTTGIDFGRYAPMGFGSAGGAYGSNGPVILPDVNLAEFQKRVFLNCAVPSSPGADGPGQFVITYDPIPAGGIGRAFISGVVLAQVNVSDSAHQYCGMFGGDTTNLSSGEYGPAHIEWRYSNTTGLMWCVIRLGMPTQQLALGKHVEGSTGGKALVTDGSGKLAEATPFAPGTYTFDKTSLTTISITIGAAGQITDISFT